jgi:hypothetical protein
MDEEWNVSIDSSPACGQLVDRLLQAGWRLGDHNVISHPTRPELNVQLDPAFDSFSFSAGLVELLMEHRKPWVKVLLDTFSE